MIHVSLRPHIRVAPGEPEALILDLAQRQLRLTGLDEVIRGMLLRLAAGPVAWDDFPADGSAAGQSAAPAALTELAERGMVHFSCTVARRELMRAVPVSRAASFDCHSDPGGKRLRLSRFPYARNLGGELVLESPRRHLRIYVTAAEVWPLLPGLAQGATVAELCAQHRTWDADVTRVAAQFLLAAGVVSVMSGPGRLDEDSDPDLAPREFHDVAFHYATREGFAGTRVGGVFPFLGTLAPAPAVKPAMSGSVVRLPTPDLDHLVQADPPLARVMEDRRSLRRYGSTELNADQLGEFLYRTARIRRLVPADPAAGLYYDATKRTYPSGGATYDLELYLTIGSCAGIRSGIYHYRPADHSLSLLCDQPESVNAMLEDGRRQSGQPDRPPILITYASRFNRLSWKYRAISYATTLRNTGVLYEAMYLVATAMGLAPCALGCGNSALFSRVTGLDPMVESSVGEFMLGTRSPLDEVEE